MIPSIGLVARTAKRAGISPSARASKWLPHILGRLPVETDRAVNVIVAGGAVLSHSPDAHPLQKCASGDPLKAHLLITSCSHTGAQNDEHDQPGFPTNLPAYGVQ